MTFSTRTTYGLRAMIYLARNQTKNSVSLAKISQDEGISLKYLEKLFASLKKAGLVKSVKGVSGGYHLTAKPSQINVFNIIKALEGRMELFHCLDKNGKIYCSKRHKCGASLVISKLQLAISQTLGKIFLSQLV